MASEGGQGFICPYCLVAFPTSDKLQSHYVDFHSEKETKVLEEYENVDYGDGETAEVVSCTVLFILCAVTLWSPL